MEHPRDHLRARRAARADEIRRRRRAAAIAAAVVAVAVVALVALASGGTGGGPAPAPVTHAAPGSQDAAVQRLASYGLPLYCGGTAKPMVALTFDDGPGPYTHFAVKKLRNQGLRATFFLVGKEIRAYPGLAATETPVAAFGDHTMTHPFLPALAQDAMRQEVAGAKASIQQATAQPVVLFRPPYGGRTPAIDAEARSLGMLQVLWNIDSGDSLGANYAGIERNVVAGLHRGSIILMHENRGQTIRALPVIFAALERDHLQAVTVPQLVADDPPSLAQLRAGGHGCGVTLKPGNGS